MRTEFVYNIEYSPIAGIITGAIRSGKWKLYNAGDVSTTESKIKMLLFFLPYKTPMVLVCALCSTRA